MSQPRPVTGGFRIRQASHDDADELATMKALAWRQSYTGLAPDAELDAQDANAPRAAEYWRRLMDTGHYFWTVVARDGRLVGIAAAQAARDADAPAPLELTMIYLLDEAKGSGIADRLLVTTIGDAPAYLWVLEDNPRARAFYERNGFVADGATQPAWGEVREIRMVRASHR